MPVLTVDYISSEAPAILCQSLKETGFAVLRNHPISSELIKDAYQKWCEFFMLDEKDKKNYLFQRSSQDGYFPFKSENAKDRKISDLKEFYHIYPWGQIPPFLKDVSLEVFQALFQLSAELLQWIENFLPKQIAKDLSMPLKNMVEGTTNTLLRVLHYPPLPKEVENDAVRAAPHEDINLITLLPAATAPGLEVLDTEGKWHAVSCDPGSIVINVGDMLQMCTQFYYKSTTHRVVNPHSSENCSRFSMPLFLHPRKEVRLSPTHTAIEYLHQRLREIGVY